METFFSIYLPKKFENSFLNEHKRFCHVNEKKVFKLKDAIKIIEVELKSSKKLLILSNLYKDVSNEAPKIKLAILTRISLSLFMELFKNVFGKLFFNFASEDAFHYIMYDKSQECLQIHYYVGVFSLALKNYFTSSLEKYNIECYEILKESSCSQSIKIVDQRKNYTFHYSKELINFNFEPYLSPLASSIEKIILFKKEVSYHTKVTRINSLENGKILPESQLSEIIKRWLLEGKNEKDQNNGIEINFDCKNHQISINYLKIEIDSYNHYLMETVYPWNILLINGFGPFILKQFVRSHEIPLNLWKLLSNNSYILIQKIDPELNPLKFNEMPIFEIKYIEECHRASLLELLLSLRPSCEITKIGLYHEFRIEIFTDNSQNIPKIVALIEEHLKISIRIRIQAQFPRFQMKDLDRLKEFDKENLKKSRITDFHRNLSWENAMKKLFEPSLHSSDIQIIQRVNNYSFNGNLAILYYKKTFNPKRFINEFSENPNQIVRIGRAERYDDTDISFIFIQSCRNRMSVGGIRKQKFPGAIILTTDLGEFYLHTIKNLDETIKIVLSTMRQIMKEID